MSKYTHINRLSKAPQCKESSISRDNLKSLKAAELKEDAVRKTVTQLLSGVSGVLAELWAPTPVKVNSMCKYYGHVINQAQWKGYLPKCADCGSEISDSAQLRKAQTAVN